MNQLSQLYYTLNDFLFPILNMDFVQLTDKMKEVSRIIEVVKPAFF